MSLKIYTDGSSLGNPGPGGWGVLVVPASKSGKFIEKSGSESHTTNNRMEIMAVIKAFEYAHKQKKKPKDTLKVEIFTDSNLVLSTMTKNWKKKTNNDLWNQLEALAKGLEIVWHKVKAHQDNKLNNRVDILARDAAGKAEHTSGKIEHTPGKTEFVPGEVDQSPETNSQRSRPVPPSKSNSYFCPKCKKETKGLIGINTAGTHIRVDCPTCRTFIKFAPQTKDTLKTAKKRVLLSENEIIKHQNILKINKITISKAKLKSYTKEELQKLINTQQSLFVSK